MKIRQFRFSFPGLGDVFGYLLNDEESGEAVAVDGGAPKEILAFLEARELTLKAVTNTHCHADHITGNKALVQASGATYLSPADLLEKGELELGNQKISVIQAPGHSEDSLVLRAGDILLTGDTLFNGTVGNCYTGDYESYFTTLMGLTKLPGLCRIYPGHDLRIYAMGVAKRLDPKNSYIDAYLASHNREEVFSFLEEELRVNPFIRWDDPALEPAYRKVAGPRKTAYQRWRLLMELH